MATERRPYHRVADSTWNETWNNDVFAFIGRLQGAMHERWRTHRLTAAEARTIRLGATDLCKVAGKRRLDIALKSARSAAEVVTISVRSLGEVTEITWAKWAEFQGLESQHGGKRVSTSSPSASSVQRPSPEEEEERAPSALARALNLLAREPGSEAEKRAFLEAELPRIEAEAFAALPADRAGDKRALNAKIRSMILGWYRQRRRSPDGPNRPTASNGRRLTAVEAGRKIVADFERRASREGSDVRETVHVVPIRGESGF